MKIKEDILKWREQLREIANQNVKMLQSADTLREDVKILGNSVQNLLKITEEMTEAMLSLIRQQIGD